MTCFLLVLIISLWVKKVPEKNPEPLKFLAFTGVTQCKIFEYYTENNVYHFQCDTQFETCTYILEKIVPVMASEFFFRE